MRLPALSSLFTRMLGFGLITCAVNGFAGSETEALWNHPAKFSSLQGKFTQFKSIDILPRPLRSEGHFVYESEGRLSWFVTSPVKSHIELYANRIVQFQGEQQVTELKADQYPFVRVMSDIFFGILSGELPHKHFHITRRQTEDGWQLELLPIDESLAQAFVSITLAGDEQLNQFTMVEVNGDRLKINFHELSYQ